MSRYRSLLLVAALCSWLAPSPLVWALGPVDGTDLAPTDLERVQVGSPAPDFALEDEKGNAVSLAQFRGKKNVVLVFYRGHW